MNKGGVQNRVGEILSELDALLEEIAPARKLQAQAKYDFENVSERMNDLQSFIYHQITIDTDIDWENPNPILNADGKPMAEFDAQYRNMMIAYLMQSNDELNKLEEEQATKKSAYYTKETNVITMMEKLGVLKAELAALTGLLRLADES